MWGIASLFLLQRLKGSMSGDAPDFNNIETRAIIKFFSPLQGKALKKIYAILRETLGEHAPSYAVKNWMAEFKRGDFSTCDAPRPAWPKTVTTPEIIDQIHELFLEDCRISAKSIAQQLGISRERVGSIIHEDLGPEMSERGSKTSTVPVVWAISGIFSARSKWLPVAIGDHGRNLVISLWPGDKEQSMDWRHSGSPRPKNFQVQKSTVKVLASIFWDQDSILLIDYLPEDQTINAEYYSSLLVQLKDILKEKRRVKFAKGVLFLHDNAPAHWALATQKELAYLGFQCLDYSPDLAPVPWTFQWSPYFVRRGSHCCRGDLVGRTIFWIFFEWLAKVTATG